MRTAILALLIACGSDGVEPIDPARLQYALLEPRATCDRTCKVSLSATTMVFVNPTGAGGPCPGGWELWASTAEGLTHTTCATIDASAGALTTSSPLGASRFGQVEPSTFFHHGGNRFVAETQITDGSQREDARVELVPKPRER
jgi:hypothetical protein